MVEWAMRHLDEGDYTYPVEPDDSNPLYSAPVAPSPYPLPVEALVFAQPVQDVPGVGPVLTPVDHDPFSTGMKPVDKLLGLGGEERYQTWPERLVRDAVVAPHDVMNNPEPMTSEQMIKPAQDIASLAAGGSMPMAARGTLGALGGKLVQVEHDPFAVAPTFYSAVENAIATNPQTKMSSDQWLGTISNSKGVKPEEIDWIGLKDFLAGKKSVTKQEVLDHVEGNKVELKEVNKGEYKPDQVDEEKYYKSIDKNAQRIFGEPYDHLNDMQQQQIRRSSFLDQNINPTKFSQWQLPGGENYREMLLTLPNQKLEQAAQKLKYFESQFKSKPIPFDRQLEHKDLQQAIRDVKKSENDIYTSSHWDEPNVLAHVRMNDRIIDGKKSLHIEEIQSDWHQKGRAEGYKQEIPEIKRQELEAIRDQLAGEVTDKFGRHANYDNPEYMSKMDRITEINKQLGEDGQNVPNAPFKKSWHELALKRMIREAAEKGYDRISWTPGEAQAARYDLSKHVKEIEYKKLDDGDIALGVKDLNGQGIPEIPYSVKPEKLADYVGKDIAKSILEKANDKSQKLTGNNLKIGGEGMKGFYDQIIPKAIERIGKEHGVKVKTANLKHPEENALAKKLKDNGYDPENVDGQQILADNHGRLPRWLNDVEFDLIAEGEHLDFKGVKHQSVHYIDIPQSLKDTALRRGFPLFSSGLMLSPVEHNPWENSK